MQRRQLLTSTAALLGGTAAGATYVQHSTDSVHASVSMGGLSIDGGQAATHDGTIQDVQVKLDGEWSYDVPGRKNPAEWQATLYARKDGEQATVASDTGDAKYLRMDGSYSLTGSLVETSLYELGDFEASENGATNTTTLNLQLVFNVFNGSEDVIAQAKLTESADVTVTNRAYSVDEHGDANGSGSVIIVE